MINTDFTTIRFHGNPIETFKESDIEWVSVRSICDGIGLHVQAQQKKLTANKKKFSCTLKRATGSDGKTYETHCIPLKKLTGWLFTIDPERVKPEIRETVELYQEECFEALHAYWHGKSVPQKALEPQMPRRLLITFWEGGRTTTELVGDGEVILDMRELPKVLTEAHRFMPPETLRDVIATCADKLTRQVKG